MKEFRDLMTKYCGLTFVACEIGTGGYTTDGSLVTGAWWTFVMTIDAAQIQNQDSQIPNYFVHPKCTNPKLFVHPKLLMASQITYGIPNYLWHPKLFVIPNYDTLNP